jgi:hypothetical protein
MWPAAAAPSWESPPARQGACQKPGSGPVHSLTLEGQIESRYQYFTRQQIGAFGAHQGASIATENGPGRSLDPFPFYFFPKKSPDRNRIGCEYIYRTFLY